MYSCTPCVVVETMRSYFIQLCGRGSGGGRNRERKCRIPRISPPTVFANSKVAKGGGVIVGFYGMLICGQSIDSLSIL